ncbi:MAG: FAD-dependent oxidoreductase, partial [Deltaproteobacteria bacterium]|nr:FAD-dependent oxidoreductase [Deltaproteobacteria bacterium]
LVTVAVEKLRKQEPFFSKTVTIHPQAVVVGGGLAGLVSSLSLSRLGVEVHLVEQTDVLGGNLKEKQYNLEGDNPQVLLRQLLEEVKRSSLIHLHLESEVVALRGQMGDFMTTLKDKDGNEDTISHGALIVATGGRERKPKEYHYGENDCIVTQKELEKIIVERKEMPDSVVMIQCTEDQGEESSDGDYHPLPGCHDLWVQGRILYQLSRGGCEIYALFSGRKTPCLPGR